MKLNIQLFAVTKSTTFAESNISIEENTSTLKITIKFSPNNDVTYFSSKTLNCTCNGVKKSASVSLSKGGSVSKTFTFSGIKHNSDGTKSVSWSWSCATGTSVLGTISDSGTRALTTIQRYGKITSVVGNTTDSTITINWHSYKADWKYDLIIQHSWDSSSFYTYTNIGSSVGDHTLDINVSNSYFNDYGSQTTLPITYNLVTYPSDETWFYNEYFNTNIQLNENAVPTIIIGTLTEADDTMIDLNWQDGSNNPIFVQNKSKINIPTTSRGVNGSGIVQTIITTNGSTSKYAPILPHSPLLHTFTTDYLKTSGSNTIEASTTDNRVRPNTSTTTYNVVPYSNPTITTANVQRCNQDKSLNDNGSYLLINFVGSISPVSNHNDKEFRIGYKKTTESSYNYVTLSSTYSVNLTNELSSFQVDPDYSYNIVFEAEDTFTTAKIDRLVEVGSDLINFNTNGKALAIGKVSEAGANEELLEVAVPTTFTEYIKDELVVESIRSKNMFSSPLELGTYDNSGNKSSSNQNYRSSNFIEVQPSTTYTFSINGVSQKYVLLYYTNTMTYISQDTSLTNGTFTTPSNCYYINIRCFNADYTSNYSSLKIQLEEGSTATTYYPYQELNPNVSDTGWINIELKNNVTARSGSYTPQYRKIGNVVYTRGQVSIPAHSSMMTITNMPEGFRPSQEATVFGIATNNWIDVNGAWWVATNNNATTNQNLQGYWLVN